MHWVGLEKNLIGMNLNSINTTNVFSSGGLNPENILDLLNNFSPFGIDIASGVETNGKKDPKKN